MESSAARELSPGVFTRERTAAFLRKYAIVFIFIGMLIALSLLSPAFLQVRNLLNVVRQVSVVGLIAFGVTTVIITGGIDLSSGSVLALAAVIAASLAQQVDWHSPRWPGLDVPLLFPIVAALAVGAFCGFLSGFTIATFRIPPFIATLGMMTIARGAALIYSERPVSGLKESYNYIGQGHFLGVPVPIIIFLGVALVMHILLSNTRFGRHVYALGGNEQAARISGISIGRVKILVYTLAGLLSGLAGLLLSSRIGSGQPGLGLGYELDAIASAVIGGTSLSGGIGTIWGTIVGALIIGVLNNGMDLLNVNAYYQTILKGFIIVAAVIIDERKNR